MNLALTNALTNGMEEAGAGTVYGDFELMTNRMPTDVEAVQYIYLEITIE